MLRRQSIFRRIKVTYSYVTVFKCVWGLLGFSGDGNFLISKGFRCYKWYIISLSLSPVNLSSSLLLQLELTKEISSLDTIEAGDANGSLLDR